MNMKDNFKVGAYVVINYIEDSDLEYWLEEQENKGITKHKITEIDYEQETFWVENCDYAIWFTDDFYIVSEKEPYELDIPKDKMIQCNMCDGKLHLYKYKSVYVWICEDCMNIQFEYENEQNLEDLYEFLKERNKENDTRENN